MTGRGIFQASFSLCEATNGAHRCLRYWAVGCQYVLPILVWSTSICIDPTSMGSWLVMMQSSGFPISSRKARSCFALLLVNALLIAGIFVSASRRSSIVSLPTETVKTIAPSEAQINPKQRSTLLQSLNVNTIPADIRNALLKVHRYLESQTTINATGTCHFAWKFNSTENNLDLFVCK